MIKQKILVTGATGDTGRHTATLLRAAGHDVRALVHHDDQRAQQLHAIGAEVVVGDLLDLKSVRKALDGTSAAYFVYPIRPGLLEASTFFAQAAREVDLKALVNMSQISARKDSNSNAALDHWVSERVFEWSGIPVTHLRPTFFAEWLAYPTFSNLVPIRSQGLINYPFESVKHAPIAAEDQARLITALLLDHAPHAGKTYPLYGPEQLSYFEIAEILGDVLDRPVTYRPIEISEFAKRLQENNAPDFLIQHLCAVAQDYREGLFSGTNDVIERITGQAPMTVRAFAEKNKDRFL